MSSVCEKPTTKADGTSFVVLGVRISYFGSKYCHTWYSNITDTRDHRPPITLNSL